MPNFENNWRRKQEVAGRPHADKIYSDIFTATANRFENPDNYILDKEFAIDVILTMPNGMIMTGQEKFLSHKYSNFETVTVEYMQNPKTQERGDWFKLGVQFYFVAYYNKGHSAFGKWMLLDWPAVVLATNNKAIHWQQRNNKYDGARASMAFVKMRDIPSNCVIASSF